MGRLLTRTGIAGVAATVLLLVGCGGGGESAPALTPQQAEDRQASASVLGLFIFASRQIERATAEDNEPRPIDGIVPPTSDSAEPQPL